MVRELPPAVRIWPRWGAQTWWCACACACQVLYCKENMAIISGLNSDAPIGTKLSFVTGGTGYVGAADRRPRMSGRVARLRVRAHQQVTVIKRYSQAGQRWIQQLFCALLQWWQPSCRQLCFWNVFPDNPCCNAGCCCGTAAATWHLPSSWVAHL